MTAEERAKAVVANFLAIPQGIRSEVEDVVARAIKRRFISWVVGGEISQSAE